MNKGRRIIGILLIIVSIAAVISWEKWGKNRFLYDSVLVFREDVAKGVTVEKEMLKTVRMDTPVDGWIAPAKQEQILGRQTATFIRGGMPLFPENFGREELLADGKRGTYILAVSPAWISSAPQSLRKGHRVTFFSRGEKITAAYVTETFGEDGFEIVVTDEQAERLSAAVKNGETFVITYY